MIRVDARAPRSRRPWRHWSDQAADRRLRDPAGAPPPSAGSASSRAISARHLRSSRLASGGRSRSSARRAAAGAASTSASAMPSRAGSPPGAAPASAGGGVEVIAVPSRTSSARSSASLPGSPGSEDRSRSISRSSVRRRSRPSASSRPRRAASTASARTPSVARTSARASNASAASRAPAQLRQRLGPAQQGRLVAGRQPERDVVVAERLGRAPGAQQGSTGARVGRGTVGCDRRRLRVGIEGLVAASAQGCDVAALERVLVALVERLVTHRRPPPGAPDSRRPCPRPGARR